MRRMWIGAAAAAALAVPAPALAQGAAAAAETITAADMARRIGVIAHDSMRGRDTPSPGLDATARWAAAEMARMGLAGGAPEGGFEQRYPLQAVTVDEASSEIVVDDTSIRFGTDAFPLTRPTPADATARVVVLSGSTGIDASVRSDVSGRHVVIVRPRDARGIDVQLQSLVGALVQARAVSVWITSAVDDRTWAADAAAARLGSVSPAWNPAPVPTRPLPAVVQIRTEAAARLLDGGGIDIAALERRGRRGLRADLVPGVRATLRMELAAEEIEAPNVVGVLEGSDPELRDEYVVFSAHIDHVGVGQPNADGDSIFNGADDDASGTAAVLEIAEAMASLDPAPRRSTVFLLVSGEEKGLWGSEWYAAHPTRPIDRFVADLNMDMVGRNWPDTIVAIGKEHSDLGEALERVASSHPELGMTPIDDLWPDEQFYFRSDHFNFARNGVPILFFFNGTHDDYHGVDDEPERIDAEKAARIARLVFYLGLEVTEADERPAWDPDSYDAIVTGR